MIFLRFFSASVLLLLCGCASIRVDENLAVPGTSFFPPNAVVRGAALKAAETTPLAQAFEQVSASRGSRTDTKALTNGPLPQFLVDEQLIAKLVAVAHQAANGGSVPHMAIERKDVESFANTLNATLLATSQDRKITPADAGKRTTQLIQRYLREYYSGDGFVDREGAQFKRPEIKTSVGNDVITAVLGITLEAVFDSILPTSVFYVSKDGKQVWQTDGNRRPTAVAVNSALAKELGSSGSITAKELKAVRYISGLAADRSKALSGAAYRSFGGADIGIVVAGKFSIGDNETLAKMFDTTFEIAAKRISEEVAIRGFAGMTGEVTVQANQPAVASPAALLLQDMATEN